MAKPKFRRAKNAVCSDHSLLEKDIRKKPAIGLITGFFGAKDYLNGAGMGVKKPQSNVPATLCGYPTEEQERQKPKSQQRVYCVPACAVCDEENQH